MTLDSRHPSVVEAIRHGQIDLVLSIQKDSTEEELTNDYIIRREAVDHDVALITNRHRLPCVWPRLLPGCRSTINDLAAKSWAEFTDAAET